MENISTKEINSNKFSLSFNDLKDHNTEKNVKVPYICNQDSIKFWLVNPSDSEFYDDQYNRIHRSNSAGIYVLWFGAYGTMLLVVFSSGLESALEEAACFLSTHFPGLLVSDEEIKELVNEAKEELGTSAEEEKIYEKATEDLTYTESGYIASYEWGIYAEPSTINEDFKKAILAFSEELNLEN